MCILCHPSIYNICPNQGSMGMRGIPPTGQWHPRHCLGWVYPAWDNFSNFDRALYCFVDCITQLLQDFSYIFKQSPFQTRTSVENSNPGGTNTFVAGSLDLPLCFSCNSSTGPNHAFSLLWPPNLLLIFLFHLLRHANYCNVTHCESSQF
jgi:hypothetical protein